MERSHIAENIEASSFIRLKLFIIITIVIISPFFQDFQYVSIA